MRTAELCPKRSKRREKPCPQHRGHQRSGLLRGGSWRREQRARDKTYVAHLEDASERGSSSEVRAVLNELPDQREREAALVLAALCGLLDDENEKVGG
jgi:hypothetical protein